ncbi:MAG: RHS repeat protein, partial [Lentisphaerae bacterium]|nr:RHS repeat protein [Lentisphaerota bacterium]
MRFWTNRLMVVLALVTGFIGVSPVYGQSAVSWGGSTLGFDSGGRLECVFSSRMDLMATFEYDGAGNLAWRVMPDQDVTSYGYDGMNRLLAVTNQGSVVSSMGYDRNGNTVAHATPLASGSLGYDAMNHLIASTQTVNSATAIVRYGYDLNG